MTTAANEQESVAAQLTELQLRFPELTGEQYLVIEQRLRKNLAMGEALRAVHLTNADEPAFVFTPGSGRSASSLEEV